MLLGFIAEAQEAQANLESAEARQQWRAWLAEAISGGASGAHSFSREKEAWQPRASTQGEISSASPCAMLRADRDQWRDIWKCGEGTAAETDEGESLLAEWLATPRGELPPIRADDIRSAAMRFPRKTSAVCGWHPRHFGLLASGTLQGLACILNMAESIGTMPTPAQAVVARLITNKRRPIG